MRSTYAYVQRASVHPFFFFFFLMPTKQPWFVIDDTSFSPRHSVSLPTLIIPEINYRRQMHSRYCTGALGNTSDMRCRTHHISSCFPAKTHYKFFSPGLISPAIAKSFPTPLTHPLPPLPPRARTLSLPPFVSPRSAPAFIPAPSSHPRSARTKSG